MAKRVTGNKKIICKLDRFINVLIFFTFLRNGLAKNSFSNFSMNYLNDAMTAILSTLKKMTFTIMERHDIQNNVIQHNNKRHNELICDTQHSSIEYC